MSRASNRITAFLPLVLLLGTTVPAQAGDQDLPTQMDFVSRLRAAPGEEGVGLGALVLPTSAEIGQLSLTLYDDVDRPRYWMAGSLSLYLAANQFGGLPHDLHQFGGFNGSLRAVPSDPSGEHPSFVGFVRGSWTMEPSGHGRLFSIVYRVDGEGLWIPMGLVRGEFDATEIASNAVDSGGFPAGAATSSVAGATNRRPSDATSAEGSGGGQSSAGGLGAWNLEPQGGGGPALSFGASATGATNLRPSRRGVIGPCLGPQTSAGSATGSAGSAWLAPRNSGEQQSSYAYAELSFVREAQGPTTLGGDLSGQAARLADMAEIGLFPRATDEGGPIVERAGAHANSTPSNGSGFLGELPTDVHLEGKILASYKIVR